MKISALSLMCAAYPALGQVHAGDLVLTVENNRVVVNAAPSGVGYSPERVFDDRFGKLGPSLPNRTPDPGFNSVVDHFVNGEPVGVRIRRAARVWRPSPTTPGDGEFCTIPEERLQIRKNGVTIETPAVDPVDFAGPTIELGTTDPFDGFIHEHAVYWLTTPHDAGVYLLEMEVWAGGVAPSEPIWLVLNQNSTASDVAAAVAWLRARLDVCPPACACDWNQSGMLSVQDLFDFLSAYFGGVGDFNGADGTTVQDIFDFLGCYFAGGG